MFVTTSARIGSPSVLVRVARRRCVWILRRRRFETRRPTPNDEGRRVIYRMMGWLHMQLVRALARRAEPVHEDVAVPVLRHPA